MKKAITFSICLLTLITLSACGPRAVEARERIMQGNREKIREKITERDPFDKLIKPDAVYMYRKMDGTELEGDFYLPKSVATTPSPVVVLIHGGGWKSGDKRAMLPFASELVKRGYACFSINYRLMPEGKFPNNVTDCKAAVQWLKRWHDTLGINPDRIAAWGGSAGGHLSAFIGATDDDDGFNAPEYETSGRVQAVVPFYGVFDFVHYSDAGIRNPEFTYMRGDGTPLEDHLKQISPITYLTADDPPVFLVHGKEDDLVPVGQSIEYNKALMDLGIKTGLIIVEGAGHGLNPTDGEMKPTWLEVVNSAIDFLDEVLK